MNHMHDAMSGTDAVDPRAAVASVDNGSGNNTHIQVDYEVRINGDQLPGGNELARGLVRLGREFYERGQQSMTPRPMTVPMTPMAA